MQGLVAQLSSTQQEAWQAAQQTAAAQQTERDVAVLKEEQRVLQQQQQQQQLARVANDSSQAERAPWQTSGLVFLSLLFGGPGG